MQLNEPGLFFYCIFDIADAQMPAAAAIRAGSCGNSVQAAGSYPVDVAALTASDVVHDLEPSTSYRAYIVAEDAFVPPNLQAVATFLDFDTLIGASRKFVGGYV